MSTTTTTMELEYLFIFRIQQKQKQQQKTEVINHFIYLSVCLLSSIYIEREYGRKGGWKMSNCFISYKFEMKFLFFVLVVVVFNENSF